MLDEERVRCGVFLRLDIVSKSDSSDMCINTDDCSLQSLGRAKHPDILFAPTDIHDPACDTPRQRMYAHDCLSVSERGMVLGSF